LDREVRHVSNGRSRKPSSCRFPHGLPGDPSELLNTFEKETIGMARLIVTALSEDTIAAPGNRQPNYIVVSVTDRHGEPVTGLGTANFQVDPMIVAPGGALVEITTIIPGRLAGFYLLEVVPIRTETWKSGVYIFAISVQSGSDKGQTLASVLLD
jgi:hypothetical protein